MDPRVLTAILFFLAAAAFLFAGTMGSPLYFLAAILFVAAGAAMLIDRARLAET